MFTLNDRIAIGASIANPNAKRSSPKSFASLARTSTRVAMTPPTISDQGSYYAVKQLGETLGIVKFSQPSRIRFTQNPDFRGTHCKFSQALLFTMHWASLWATRTLALAGSKLRICWDTHFDFNVAEFESKERLVRVVRFVDKIHTEVVVGPGSERRWYS
jgi:hypothetical protein